MDPKGSGLKNGFLLDVVDKRGKDIGKDIGKGGLYGGVFGGVHGGVYAPGG